MKKILACLVGVCLLATVASRVAQADVVPPGPPIPERTKPTQRKTESIPFYTIAGGIGALAMTGSFIALRVIRKRNGKLPD